ncbi:MAG: hypothetical protein FD129_8 [bacterium]|nr:MAG: hypothetical protein FD129_8 [bacterium]
MTESELLSLSTKAEPFQYLSPTASLVLRKESVWRIVKKTSVGRAMEDMPSTSPGRPTGFTSRALPMMFTSSVSVSPSPLPVSVRMVMVGVLESTKNDDIAEPAGSPLPTWSRPSLRNWYACPSTKVVNGVPIDHDQAAPPPKIASMAVGSEAKLNVEPTASNQRPVVASYMLKATAAKPAGTSTAVPPRPPRSEGR